MICERLNRCRFYIRIFEFENGGGERIFVRKISVHVTGVSSAATVYVVIGLFTSFCRRIFVFPSPTET